MTSNKNTNQIQGFTLVELLLAMTGVAILLVAVATTTIQLMNMYHKGITIKTINPQGPALRRPAPDVRGPPRTEA